MFKDVILEAKDIWKRYAAEDGSWRWVLCGINMEVAKGDFISILGNQGAGKSVLLKVLGFREAAERGEVYFEGRLVGRTGAGELSTMQDERVLLVAGPMKGNEDKVLSGQRVAVVLLDEPVALLDSKKGKKKWEQLRALNRSGLAVVIATSEPAVAAQADITYKLVEGKLVMITGMIRP